MSDSKQQKNQQINIEVDETTAQGDYSNLAIINHSPSEFVVDFVAIMPGTSKAKVKSRIILTRNMPKGFKVLWLTTLVVMRIVMERLILKNHRQFR